MNATTPHFVLAAGGTGGHLFPAQALAEQLVRQGATVCLATDRRAEGFGAALPGVTVERIAAGRIGGGAVKSALGLVTMVAGFVQARRLLRARPPAAVIGFGGYPSLPTMLAAIRLGVSTVIHEQNAILGRANRLLARRVEAIAAGFADTAGVRAGDRARLVHTSNPVRPAIRAVAGAEYRPPGTDEPIKLVVLGGSQGASVFADLVPTALALLPPALRARLRLSQQARPEDCERVSAALDEAGIVARVAEFFTDVPERLAKAQLVICRAGASTLAELAAIGRPALLVPYPYAADDHQSANARAFAAAGAGWHLPQSGLNPQRLSELLAERLADPAGLTRAAAAARSLARDDAAERLAAMVLPKMAAVEEPDHRVEIKPREHAA